MASTLGLSKGRALVLMGGWIAACAAPVVAQASATVDASISGLHWTLTDLDPLDGIAPSIAFSGASLVRTGVGVAPWGPFTNTGGDLVGVPTSIDSGGDPSATYGVAGIDPAGAGGYRLWVTGQAVDNGYFLGETRFFGTGFECCFTLSPHTRIVFSGVATLQAGRSDPAWDNTGGAEAFLTVVGPGVADPAGQQIDSLALPSFWSGSSSFASRTLTVTYLNDTADPLWGGFNANVSGSAISHFASAVPEPHTAVGLLGGAALLWTTRRRASRTYRGKNKGLSPFRS
jgi:hypothetical protein